MAVDGVINRNDLLRVMEAYCGSQERALRALDILDGVEQERAAAALAPLTVASAVAQHLQTQQKLSPDSLDTYKRVLEAFALWVSARHPMVGDLKFGDFDTFVSRD